MKERKSVIAARTLQWGVGGGSWTWVAALSVVLSISCISGTASADSTGEQSPTVTAGSFPDASNAFACDGVVTSPNNNDVETYSVYGLAVPDNAIITGIQVRVRANDGSSNNRKFRVSLSWDGGTTFTSTLNTRNFRRNSPLQDYIVGGPAVLWGRLAWAPSELSDTNFQVKLQARRPGGSEAIHLDCVPVTVFYRLPGAPNLSLVKTDSPDPVQPQQDLTYTIAYSNTGESTATNVILTDVVPANTTFVSASPDPASAPAVGGGGTVTWNVGSVPPGGSGMVTLVANVDANLPNGTQILNDTYSIASDQNSPTAGNVVATTVQGTIALAVSQTASPDPVAPGATLTYVVTITNAGNVPSTNVFVDETYDGNVNSPTLASTTCTGLSANPPDLDQFTIPTLAADSSCTITITTTVSSTVADGVLLTNFVEVFDDAGNDATASVVTTAQIPAVCGNGVIERGESCDEGSANGTAGSCCTATCTFRPGGEECRPAAGDCDIAEVCSGSSATCPDDAFVSAGVACADDGNPCTDDQCDGTGQCINIPNTDPCSDGDGCTVGDVCSSGSCQPGARKSCDDNNPCTDDSCSSPSGACVNTPNSNPCDDGDACSSGDRCSGGVCQGVLGQCGDGILQPACGEQCDDGNTVDGDGCAANCTLEPCGPEPDNGCRLPAVGQKASVVLRNKTDDRRDSVTWKWSKGAATQKTDFGNPRDAADDTYQFCIYRDAAPRLVMSATVPAAGMCSGKPCWKETRSGFVYKNRALTPAGIGGVVLKAGADKRASIVVKGKGASLHMPDLTTLGSPVTVELKNLKSGTCWMAVYSSPSKATPELVKAKAN